MLAKLSLYTGYIVCIHLGLVPYFAVLLLTRYISYKLLNETKLPFKLSDLTLDCFQPFSHERKTGINVIEHGVNGE